MPAAARHGRLPGVNLPAASAFVNPDSAHHGPRREAGGHQSFPLMQQRPSMGGPRQDRCRWRDRQRGPGREALDAPCRCPRTDAGGTLGRDAPLDAGTGASGGYRNT